MNFFLAGGWGAGRGGRGERSWGQGKGLDLTLKAKATKAKINEWGYIKLKVLYIAEETSTK